MDSVGGVLGMAADFGTVGFKSRSATLGELLKLCEPQLPFLGNEVERVLDEKMWRKGPAPV